MIEPGLGTQQLVQGERNLLFYRELGCCPRPHPGSPASHPFSRSVECQAKAPPQERSAFMGLKRPAFIKKPGSF